MQKFNKKNVSVSFTVKRKLVKLKRKFYSVLFLVLFVYIVLYYSSGLWMDSFVNNAKKLERNLFESDSSFNNPVGVVNIPFYQEKYDKLEFTDISLVYNKALDVSFFLCIDTVLKPNSIVEFYNKNISKGLSDPVYLVGSQSTMELVCEFLTTKKIAEKRFVENNFTGDSHLDALNAWNRKNYCALMSRNVYGIFFQGNVRIVGNVFKGDNDSVVCD